MTDPAWMNSEGVPVEIAEWGTHPQVGFPVVVLRDDQVDRIARRVVELMRTPDPNPITTPMITVTPQQGWWVWTCMCGTTHSATSYASAYRDAYAHFHEVHELP